MNNNVLVSIIIPVYNVEKYIVQCLDSVLEQSYNNIEVILVDDGSTDKSGDICDEYVTKDKRFKVIHKDNEGVSAARNVGMNASNGEFICFSDADDYLMPDYIEYLLSIAMANNTDISLTTSMLSTFTDMCFNNDTNGHVNVVSGEDAAVKILYYHIPIGCYCKLFKRHFLEINNIKFLPDVFVGEGFNFNTNAFLHANKVAIGNKKIYCYRRDNPASCMTHFDIRKADMAIKAIKILHNNIENKNIRINKACQFALWHTVGDMYNWMVLAKVKKQYRDTYHKYYILIKKDAFRALISPINKKERFRALIQLIHPRLFAALLELRRWKFNKVSK